MMALPHAILTISSKLVDKPNFGVNGAWRTAMYLAIVAVVGAVAAWRLTQSRQRRRAKAVAATAQPGPEPVGA